MAPEKADFTITGDMDISAIKKKLSMTSKLVSQEAATINKKIAKYRVDNTMRKLDTDKTLQNLGLDKATMAKELADMRVMVERYAQGIKKSTEISTPKVKTPRFSMGDKLKEVGAEFGPEVANNVKKVYKSLDKTIPAAKRASIAIRKVKKEMKSTSSATGGLKGALIGLGMSVMFAGMAMKRMFDTIWKASTKVFNDIMHSTEGTVTSFDRLNSSMTYLKFVVGEALSPIVEMLTPIIWMIAQWVEDNPKLAAGLIITLGVLGTIMGFLGQIILLVGAIVFAWPFIAEAATAAFGVIEGISLPVILAIIAIVLALVAMWNTNFGGMRDFVKETFGTIWDTIKSVFKDIKEVFIGLWMFIEGIFEGDFEKMWNGLVKIVFYAISAIIKIIWAIGTVLGNVCIFIINSVKDAIFLVVNLIIGALKVVAGWVDDVFGTNFADAIASAQAMVRDFQNTITIDYVSSDTTGKVNDAISNITDQIADYISFEDEKEELEDAIKTPDKNQFPLFDGLPQVDVGPHSPVSAPVSTETTINQIHIEKFEAGAATDPEELMEMLNSKIEEMK